MSNNEAPNLQPSTQLLGGDAGTAYVLTPEKDKRRIHLVVPPRTAIPVVFIPGIMGTNLRMTKKRQAELGRKDNRAWRPDDKLDTLSKFNDAPDERQRHFDPDETEVEVYQWSSDAPGTPEDEKRFDASQANDKRHDNVPDSFSDIPPLLTTDPVPTGPSARPVQGTATAAQKARWRGWSEVMFDSYGTALVRFEGLLNNAAKLGKIDHHWTYYYYNRPPSTWAIPNGTTLTEPLSEEEVQKLESAWLPVHAMGYNWLKSNGESAKFMAKRIKDLIALYKAKGFECPGVMVVTHSMGGLVARGLMHPNYGGLTETEVLGIVHGVMPTVGAAASYKRMRTGFEGGRFYELSKIITQKILGSTGQDATPVMANAQGPLELLPSDAYGMDWLEVQDKNGKPLVTLPHAPTDDEMLSWKTDSALYRQGLISTVRAPQSFGTPAKDIYNKPNAAWWRLINPEWVDPAERYLGKEGQAMLLTKERISKALKFQSDLDKTFHPDTYAHYGRDHLQPAYGKVVWRVTSGDTSTAGSPLNWQLISEDGEGELKVRGMNGATLTLKMQAPAEEGDGTVPAQASASKVKGKTFVQRGYEHQNSYKSHDVLAATVYGLVKIAATVLPTPQHNKK